MRKSLFKNYRCFSIRDILLPAIRLLLSVLIIAFICRIPAPFAKSVPTVGLHQYYNTDDKIEIRIKIANTSEAGIRGYSLRLDYNPDTVSNPSIPQNTFSENYADFFQAKDPADRIGKFSVGALFNSPLAQDILIKILFDVSPGFKCGTSNIKFVSTTNPDPKTNLFDKDYNEIDSVFINPVPGDINGSGTVDLADAVTGLQILAGIPEKNIYLSADINCDNHIGMENVIYILQNLTE
ncbi:MAG: hypothetical protein GY795_36435 [Desulfobacterales bacterium]|nr:hypothetical protein [Desulfobacterales bacterium]